MTFSAGIDRTTGALISAADWNKYLGITGSIMETAPAKVTTAGDLVYATGPGALARLALGSKYQTFRVDAGASAPEWFTPPMALVYRSASLGLTSGSTTAVTFDSEVFDQGALHDAASNTNRLTPTITGIWRLWAMVTFPANATGGRQALIRDQAGATVWLSTEKGQATYDQTVVVDACVRRTSVAGAWYELALLQDSGGTLTVSGGITGIVFGMQWLGPE